MQEEDCEEMHAIVKVGLWSISILVAGGISFGLGMLIGDSLWRMMMVMLKVG